MIRRVPMLGAFAVLALVGCSASEPGTGPTGGASVSASPSPTPSDAPVELVFTLPTDCTFLPATRLARFTADGLELLGGPGSRYEDDYFLEPTPEENAGGISCVWGDDTDLTSTITVSVAPVNLANRSAIVSDLIAQGLNEVQLDDALTYGQIGDENSTPAILNVVRTESWISVIEALGGDSRFERATEIVEEVAALVYRVAD